MMVDGRKMNESGENAVLKWPGRVVTAEALECRLNGHRRLLLPADAIITPLAQDHLRANNVETSRWTAQHEAARIDWGCTHDAAHPLIDTALTALAREGVALQKLPACPADAVCKWAKEVADCVASGQCCGGVVFCRDPGLFCCIANKCHGLRAVPVTTVLQAANATRTVGANLLAVEMPGRTFFEIRQILRLACQGTPRCPDGVACVLGELESN